MKLGKIDFCKIKRVTAIEILVLALFFVALGIYFTPNFIAEKEIKKMAKVKADNAIFSAKVLEEFAQNKNQKASIIAQKVADELNKTTINPYNKKLSAYVFEEKCDGCNCVNFDDEAQMVVLTGYNNKGELIARTVIKPPSFVVYSKLDDLKTK